MAIDSRYKAKFGKEVEALPVPIQNNETINYDIFKIPIQGRSRG